MTDPTPDRTGYSITTQVANQVNGALSYAVTRTNGDVGIGAYFSLAPGGDIDQAIARDRAYLEGQVGNGS